MTHTAPHEFWFTAPEPLAILDGMRRPGHVVCSKTYVISIDRWNEWDQAAIDQLFPFWEAAFLAADSAPERDDELCNAILRASPEEVLCAIYGPLNFWQDDAETQARWDRYRSALEQARRSSERRAAA